MEPPLRPRAERDRRSAPLRRRRAGAALPVIEGKHIQPFASTSRDRAFIASGDDAARCSRPRALPSSRGSPTATSPSADQPPDADRRDPAGRRGHDPHAVLPEDAARRGRAAVPLRDVQQLRRQLPGAAASQHARDRRRSIERLPVPRPARDDRGLRATSAALARQLSPIPTRSTRPRDAPGARRAALRTRRAQEFEHVLGTFPLVDAVREAAACGVYAIRYSHPLHAQLRVRHRPAKVHRLSRVHDRLQGRARDSGRREPLLGQDGREGHVPRHAAASSSPSSATSATTRRACGSARPTRSSSAATASSICNGDVVHRLPRLHGGVPVRSAVHRSEHAHRREVQLLREPGREQAAAGVRERLPDRVPHLRRPRRSDERGRADRAARSVHGAQAGEGHGAEGLLPRRRRERRSGRKIASRPFMLQGRPGAPAAARRRRRRIRESPGDPRVDYDVPHGKPWGIDMVLYLLIKGISTGAMLLAALLWLLGDRTAARRRSPAPVDLARVRRRSPRSCSSSTSSGPSASTTSSRGRTGVVDGVGRVLPDRARRAQRPVARRGDGSAATAVLTVLALAGDRRRDPGAPPTRASCSRRGWRAICGRDRTRRSI